jgi:hypothetical protein
MQATARSIRLAAAEIIGITEFRDLLPVGRRTARVTGNGDQSS